MWIWHSSCMYHRPGTLMFQSSHKYSLSLSSTGTKHGSLPMTNFTITLYILHTVTICHPLHPCIISRKWLMTKITLCLCSFCHDSMHTILLWVLWHRWFAVSNGTASNYKSHKFPWCLSVLRTCPILMWLQTRGQSNLTKSASRGAHSPVRGHPRGSKVVPLNSWGRVSY